VAGLGAELQQVDGGDGGGEVSCGVRHITASKERR